jgi:hypothetical protein
MKNIKTNVTSYGIKAEAKQVASIITFIILTIGNSVYPEGATSSRYMSSPCFALN